MKKDKFSQQRENMVYDQILRRGIYDKGVLEAFRNVPRHLFVPPAERSSAYNDQPLSIGQKQTISQPYIVALMTKHLELKPGMSVLEIGTGSGYQTAILLYLGANVYSIERIPSLAEKAKEVLDSLNYGKINIKIGDGSLGRADKAPYDRIIVTASALQIPDSLIAQLKIGGKIVIPLGDKFRQDLTIVTKLSDKNIKKDVICGCVFVPLIGECGWDESS